MHARARCGVVVAAVVARLNNVLVATFSAVYNDRLAAGAEDAVAHIYSLQEPLPEALVQEMRRALIV